MWTISESQILNLEREQARRVELIHQIPFNCYTAVFIMGAIKLSPSDNTYDPGARNETKLHWHPTLTLSHLLSFFQQGCMESDWRALWLERTGVFKLSNDAGCEDTVMVIHFTLLSRTTASRVASFCVF